jgi:DNA-binding NtrC family response regulator
VVIVTGYASADSAVEAMKSGCADYLQKPFRLERLQAIAQQVMARRAGGPGRRAARARHRFGALLGSAPPMQLLFRRMRALAAAEGHVLLLGESGTGKQLAAREIHRHGRRRAEPFQVINCRAVGHAAPHPNADPAMACLLESGAGGSYFLEEVCSLPSALQQALAQRLARAAAETAPRILAASEQDPAVAQARGALDPALYAHLSDGQLAIPPLRERREDIALLVLHLLRRLLPTGRNTILGVSEEALDLLLDYDWPGNLLQLESVIQRAYALKGEGLIEVADLPAELRTFGRLQAEDGC